jgi:hypothetical protein
MPGHDGKRIMRLWRNGVSSGNPLDRTDMALERRPYPL